MRPFAWPWRLWGFVRRIPRMLHHLGPWDFVRWHNRHYGLMACRCGCGETKLKFFMPSVFW
jgi:hypothetical protein